MQDKIITVLAVTFALLAAALVFSTGLWLVVEMWRMILDP